MKVYALKHVKSGGKGYYPGSRFGDAFDTDAETAKGLLDAGLVTRDEAERIEVDVPGAPPAPQVIKAPAKAPAKATKVAGKKR